MSKMSQYAYELEERQMEIAEALQIVLDLASSSALKEEDCDNEDAHAERIRQRTAINVVIDLAVNQFGDD